MAHIYESVATNYRICFSNRTPALSIFPTEEGGLVMGGWGWWGRESEQSGEIEQVAQQAETDCGDEDEGQVSQ